VFANRFTVLVDACSLVPVLSRNLLLSLAKDEFFRIRWSARILDETEGAMAKQFEAKRLADPAQRARKARAAMENAFEDASVAGYEVFAGSLTDLPDPDDAHVIAAAVQTRASVIVTENTRHFPKSVLTPLNLEAKTADAFVADTIDLDVGRAIATVRRMRERLHRPEKTPEILLLDLDALGFTQTVDALREHLLSL